MRRGQIWQILIFFHFIILTIFENKMSSIWWYKCNILYYYCMNMKEKVKYLTWRKVLAPGALVFSIMDKIEKMIIWIVAPPAYQYGPLIPYYEIKYISKWVYDIYYLRMFSVSWCEILNASLTFQRHIECPKSQSDLFCFN